MKTYKTTFVHVDISFESNDNYMVAILGPILELNLPRLYIIQNFKLILDILCASLLSLLLLIT